MREADWKGPLGEAHELALRYLEGISERAVRVAPTAAELREALGGELPDEPADAGSVVADLARAAEPGIMPSGSGRYFGFVIGGALPAAMAADWLVSAWDQNAALYAAGPSASVVEEIAGRWVAELLGLPAGVSVGFVTSAQAATFTGLRVGLDVVLARHGWDLARDGLSGAPPVRVLAGTTRHGTVDRAVRFLNLGAASVVPVESDRQGRMLVPALRAALEREAGPVLVSTQVGDVNTGAIDPVGEICAVAHEHGAWVHVDGAFGLWAAASPALRPKVAGLERADSWSTDGHKWLNVPYDSGIILCAHSEAHQRAMAARGGYLQTATDGRRDEVDYVPDHSRRARGFPVYAALRSLGRQGVADLVERSCALARRFAARLAAVEGFEVLNEVELNQVLVRAAGTDGDPDGPTQRLVERLQRDGTAWMSGTTWQGRAALRISVSNWRTDESDVDETVTAIVRCAAQG